MSTFNFKITNITMQSNPNSNSKAPHKLASKFSSSGLNSIYINSNTNKKTKEEIKHTNINKNNLSSNDFYFRKPINTGNKDSNISSRIISKVNYHDKLNESPLLLKSEDYKNPVLNRTSIKETFNRFVKFDNKRYSSKDLNSSNNLSTNFNVEKKDINKTIEKGNRLQTSLNNKLSKGVLGRNLHSRKSSLNQQSTSSNKLNLNVTNTSNNRIQTKSIDISNACNNSNNLNSYNKDTGNTFNIKSIENIISTCTAGNKSKDNIEKINLLNNFNNNTNTDNIGSNANTNINNNDTRNYICKNNNTTLNSVKAGVGNSRKPSKTRKFSYEYGFENSKKNNKTDFNTIKEGRKQSNYSKTIQSISNITKDEITYCEDVVNQDKSKNTSMNKSKDFIIEDNKRTLICKDNDESNINTNLSSIACNNNDEIMKICKILDLTKSNIEDVLYKNTINYNDNNDHNNFKDKSKNYDNSQEDVTLEMLRYTNSNRNDKTIKYLNNNKDDYSNTNTNAITNNKDNDNYREIKRSNLSSAKDLFHFSNNYDNNNNNNKTNTETENNTDTNVNNNNSNKKTIMNSNFIFTSYQNNAINKPKSLNKYSNNKTTTNSNNNSQIRNSIVNKHGILQEKNSNCEYFTNNSQIINKSSNKNNKDINKSKITSPSNYQKQSLLTGLSKNKVNVDFSYQVNKSHQSIVNNTTTNNTNTNTKENTKYSNIKMLNHNISQIITRGNSSNIKRNEMISNNTNNQKTVLTDNNKNSISHTNINRDTIIDSAKQHYLKTSCNSAAKLQTRKSTFSSNTNSNKTYYIQVSNQHTHNENKNLINNQKSNSTYKYSNCSTKNSLKQNLLNQSKHKHNPPEKTESISDISGNNIVFDNQDKDSFITKTSNRNNKGSSNISNTTSIINISDKSVTNSNNNSNLISNYNNSKNNNSSSNKFNTNKSTNNKKELQINNINSFNHNISNVKSHLNSPIYNIVYVKNGVNSQTFNPNTQVNASNINSFLLNNKKQLEKNQNYDDSNTNPAVIKVNISTKNSNNNITKDKDKLMHSSLHNKDMQKQITNISTVKFPVKISNRNNAHNNIRKELKDNVPNKAINQEDNNSKDKLKIFTSTSNYNPKSIKVSNYNKALSSLTDNKEKECKTFHTHNANNSSKVKVNLNKPDLELERKNESYKESYNSNLISPNFSNNVTKLNKNKQITENITYTPSNKPSNFYYNQNLNQMVLNKKLQASSSTNNTIISNHNNSNKNNLNTNTTNIVKDNIPYNTKNEEIAVNNKSTNLTEQNKRKISKSQTRIRQSNKNSNDFLFNNARLTKISNLTNKIFSKNSKSIDKVLSTNNKTDSLNNNSKNKLNTSPYDNNTNLNENNNNEFTKSQDIGLGNKKKSLIEMIIEDELKNKSDTDKQEIILVRNREFDNKENGESYDNNKNDDNDNNADDGLFYYTNDKAASNKIYNLVSNKNQDNGISTAISSNEVKSGNGNNNKELLDNLSNLNLIKSNLSSFNNNINMTNDYELYHKTINYLNPKNNDLNAFKSNSNSGFSASQSNVFKSTYANTNTFLALSDNLKNQNYPLISEPHDQSLCNNNKNKNKVDTNTEVNIQETDACNALNTEYGNNPIIPSMEIKDSKINPNNKNNPTDSDFDNNESTVKIYKSKIRNKVSSITSKLSLQFILQNNKIKSSITSYLTPKDSFNLIFLNKSLKHVMLSTIREKHIVEIIKDNPIMRLSIWKSIFYYSAISYSDKNSVYLENLSLAKKDKEVSDNLRKDKTIQLSRNEQEAFAYIYQIEKDVNRTFPKNPMFKGLESQKLTNVLMAFAKFNSKIGYAQGMNFIAANALLVLDSEADCFVFMDAIINKFHLDKILSINNSGIGKVLGDIDLLVKKHVPRLVKFLENHYLTQDFITTQWVITLFSSSMEPQMLFKFWDLMLLFDWNFVVYFTISILKQFEDIICSWDQFGLSVNVKNLLKTDLFYQSFLYIVLNSFEIMNKH